MKKIKTLFVRNFTKDHKVLITEEVTQECEWVLEGEGVATKKVDGEACMILNGEMYVRYATWEGNAGISKRSIKAGKPARIRPDRAIPCQEKPDVKTGSFPCWVPLNVMEYNPTYKIHRQMWEEVKDKIFDGTFELCGPNFQNNTENLPYNLFIAHGSIILPNVVRSFDGIRTYLENNYIEGIVFHRSNGDMCKIKRTDFGFEWNGSDKR